MRRMMVAVAIFALVLGTVEGLRRRRESYRRRADMFAQKVSAAIMDEQSYRMSRRGSTFGYDPRTTTAYYQLVEHFDSLRVKYERAADRLWLFVTPDPPEPTWPNGVQRR
jgi:hypothetical protein